MIDQLTNKKSNHLPFYVLLLSCYFYFYFYLFFTVVEVICSLREAACKRKNFLGEKIMLPKAFWEKAEHLQKVVMLQCESLRINISHPCETLSLT